MSVLLLLLASRLALAGEGITLDPPLPVAGEPWSATATAWDLPPQRPEYLTEEVEELRCPLRLEIQPDGSHQVDGSACPASMVEDALAAAGRWSFAPVEAEGPTVAGLQYVVRYSHSLGAMTLHAEVDPGAGAARAGVEGRPGLKLVHEARPDKPLVRKLPGKAAKAGLGDTACHFRVRVGTSGRALETLVLDCPDALVEDATRRAVKARYIPTRVDGRSQEDVVDVQVTYQR